jgi:hypothetical protein
MLRFRLFPILHPKTPKMTKYAILHENGVFVILHVVIDFECYDFTFSCFRHFDEIVKIYINNLSIIVQKHDLGTILVLKPLLCGTFSYNTENTEITIFAHFD